MVIAPRVDPEWQRQADEEPYRIGARLNARGLVGTWFVRDCRTEEEVKRFKTREAAIACADKMNEEHRRWFR
jgi:hypothetical protein